MEKKAFHEKVAENLIEQLRQGTAPWQKPWQPGEPGAYLPVNPVTGKRYKGINALHLMGQNRDDQRWMTYKQAEALGAQVRKGEKGSQVQYWKFREEQVVKDAEGKPVVDDKGEAVKALVEFERPRVFFSTVFNAGQIDGLPPLVREKQEWDAIERAEGILQASGAVITHGGRDRAYYQPATDSIHLPDKGRFPQASNYYATALHELGHWTGHESRLARDLVHPFGSEGYAREELRAEIASLMLGDELGIGHDPGQHAAYVNSWIKALQDDPREIFRAAADAEKIQDYLLVLEKKQDLEADMPATQGTEIKIETEYQRELARLLKVSTLTPGAYVPSEDVKNTKHAAVFVDFFPQILCGPANDPKSEGIAKALAESPHVRKAFEAAGIKGEVESGVMVGRNILWQEQESAVVSKPSGQVEAGADSGPLVAIVLNDKGNALAANLCITTETARIFDPLAPDLDDGSTLASLTDVTSRAKKTYLKVPFKEKNSAKVLGAKWDKDVKSWYVPEGVELTQFAIWLPAGKDVPEARPAANLLPQEEFAQALQNASLMIEGEPAMDGKIHRVPVVGGKAGAMDGAYCGYMNGRAGGWVQNHKTGEKTKWVSTGHVLTEKKIAEMATESADQMKEMQVKAMKRAFARWINAPEAKDHPYLTAKGIEGEWDGLKQDANGNLLIPGFNIYTGRLQTLQRISPEGEKRFESGCPKSGAACLINQNEDKELTGEILIAEGYATGVSLYQATGIPVAVAFDAGNLLEVAENIREKYPHIEITICADNDHSNAAGNIGVEKAKAAALAVGGKVIVPTFTREEKAKGCTDFNDLFASRGIEAVKKDFSRSKSQGAER
ncbi:MAG: zincin-like metallopeptidase domain-containing protein [Desulfocapsaceae bacterium]|nr:zincin-like metallopeptidase domain-containing protein [Desulfocapsaceae bacterium]